MKKVFLSYARADGSAASAKLRTELERAGFEVWRDIEEMQGGQAWKDQIRKAVRQVDAVLVLFTPASVESVHVRWEWEQAITLEKQVIPLLIQSCTVPDDLADLHYHDLSKPEGYSVGFAALIRDLNGLPGAEAAVTPSTQAEPRSAPKYEVHQADRSAIGDRARVVNYGTDMSEMGDALARVFDFLTVLVQRKSADDQEQIQPVIDQMREKAQKIAQGDESEEAQSALEKRLINLRNMAPDIGDVVIASLVNPAAGIAMTIKKIAEKVQSTIRGKAG